MQQYNAASVTQCTFSTCFHRVLNQWFYTSTLITVFGDFHLLYSLRASLPCAGCGSFRNRKWVRSSHRWVRWIKTHFDKTDLINQHLEVDLVLIQQRPGTSLITEQPCLMFQSKQGKASVFCHSDSYGSHTSTCCDFRLIYILSKVRKYVWMFSIASHILYLHCLQKQNRTRIANNKT